MYSGHRVSIDAEGVAVNRFSELFTRALGAYITHLQAMFEIQDWRIELLGTYPDTTDAAASMKCIYGQRLAQLALSKEFFDYPSDRQRHYIVHEIVHVITDGCDNVIENGLSTVMGMPAFTVLQEAWRVQVEYLTDHLTYAFVDLLVDGPKHDRLWENVLRAERDELPLPNPETAAAGPTVTPS